jgi:hypothetical protein
MTIRLLRWLPDVTRTAEQPTRKWQTLAFLLALCLLTFLPPPLYAEMPLPQISPKLSLSASLRARVEFWDWFGGSSGDNSYVYGATVAKFGLKWSDELFDLYVETQTDNRPATVRNADRRHIAIHTGGGHLVHVIPTDIGPIDLMGWGVGQGGDWGKQDHQAWAFALETGWQPKMLPWNPWFRVGYNRSSGGDDPSDGDHETFFQILPTARVYSFSTFYNFMNNEDAFFQLILRPIKGQQLWVKQVEQ